MLNLFEYEPITGSALSMPTSRRSPEIALLLSLLFPGLGHLYIGLRRNGAWIIGLELLALLLIYSASGTWHAQAVLAFPVLYCFAMIDAYFSAREWNAGVTSLMTGANPRITAVLNLLTKGFGYFYLGDRTKGIVCFFVVFGVQAALLLKINAWMSILAVTIQVVIAVDGYRVARQRLLAAHPELTSVETTDAQIPSTNPIALANPALLDPRLVTGMFAIVCVLVAGSYCVLRVLDGHPVRSRGTLESGSDGLLYHDHHEGISLTLPETWFSERSDGALARFDGDGANIIMQEQYALYSISSLLPQIQFQFRKNHPDVSFTPCKVELSGMWLPCFEGAYTTSTGVEIKQRVVARRHFYKIFILIETWRTPVGRKDLDGIEKNLQFR